MKTFNYHTVLNICLNLFQMYQSDIDVYLDKTTEAKIQIKSTIPIACKNADTCPVKIELYSFKHQFVDNQPHCNKSLLDPNPKPSSCSFDFHGKRWNSYQSMSVSLLRDETSRGSYRAIVQLRAISGTDKLWGPVFLPEMKVKTLLCNDTHISYCLCSMSYSFHDNSYYLKLKINSLFWLLKSTLNLVNNL